jgi:ketosteroid isomerase-like protein
MRLRILLLALNIAFAGFVTAQSKPAPEKIEDQILKAESDWLDAESKGDIPALQRLIAEDFIGTGFGGNVLTRDDIVPADSTGPRMSKATLRSTSVRVFGDTAVLMGAVTTGDEQHPGGFRVTTVYQKRAQGWQMIAAHLARSPAQE